MRAVPTITRSLPCRHSLSPLLVLDLPSSSSGRWYLVGIMAFPEYEGEKLQKLLDATTVTLSWEDQKDEKTLK